MGPPPRYHIRNDMCVCLGLTLWSWVSLFVCVSEIAIEKWNAGTDPENLEGEWLYRFIQRSFALPPMAALCGHCRANQNLG